MAGMLGSGSGYRRAVLAVAVTGTVCAGVGLAWYFGMKKLRDRESLSPADSEAEKSTAAVKEDPEPSKSPEKVPQVPATSEKTKPTEPKPTSGPILKPSFQPKVSDKPPPPSTASSTLEKAKDRVEEVKASKVAESLKSSAAKAQEKAAEIASKVETIASGVQDKAKEQISALPTREKLVSSIDNVVVTVKEEAKRKLEVIGGKASGDGPGSLSSMESRLDSDIVVIDDAKGVPGAADEGVGATEGAGDVKAMSVSSSPGAPAAAVTAPAAPLVQVPAKEMLPSRDVPSMGPPSSLGDDIEIIHDAPSMVEDALSGDFVKCDKDTDLAQSIEIIKPAVVKPQEKKPEEKKPIEKRPEEKKPETSQLPKPAGVEGKSVGQTSTHVKPKHNEDARALGDSNANFQPPSSSSKKEVASGIPKPTKKQEPKEKQPEEIK